MTSRKEDGYNKLLPSRIRDIMSKYKIKQKDLAEKTGISRQSIGYYADGSNVPDAEKLALIAKALNVSADYLLGLSDNETPINNFSLVTCADAINLINAILAIPEIEISVNKRSYEEPDTPTDVTLTFLNDIIVNYYHRKILLDDLVESMPESSKKLGAEMRDHALNDLLNEAKKQSFETLRKDLEDKRTKEYIESRTIPMGEGILLDIGDGPFSPPDGGHYGKS